MLIPQEDREQACYLVDDPAPRVIVLNSVAAEAGNHVMLAVTSLHADDHDHAAVLHRPCR